MLEHTGFHDIGHYSPNCPKCIDFLREGYASLNPPWLMEYDKEQNDKLAIIEKQIRQLKESDFAEIPYASKIRKVQLDGGQFVYEKVLRLIRKMEGEK